ncbi:MAG: cytochrome c-type biogenesis protein CcmH [Magnetococcales bacterium]|nr:cytochrome c-type biogenesis protein CcmH [Magnetococcales bacterium]
MIFFSHPFWALLLLMLAMGTAHAEVRNEDPTEAMVRQIAKDLRCAVCQNQSVYESNSELAKDMLKLIRDKVTAGEKEPAIRDYFHQRYGDYIYLEPTGQGMNALLWSAPFLGLGLGGYALWLAMRRWRAQAVMTEKTASQTPPPTPDAAMQSRIQQELERMRM